MSNDTTLTNDDLLSAFLNEGQVKNDLLDRIGEGAAGSLTIQANTLNTFKTAYVIRKVNAEGVETGETIPVDRGGLAVAKMALVEAQVKRQFKKGVPDEIRAAGDFDHPEWSQAVIQFQIGLSLDGFGLGIVLNQDGEDTLVRLNDSLYKVYTDRNGVLAQTPMIHAQMMNPSPQAIEVFQSMLVEWGYIPFITESNDQPDQGVAEPSTTSSSVSKWRMHQPLPANLETADLGQQLRWRVEHGMPFEAITLLKDNTEDDPFAFQDFLKVHQNKRDIITAAQKAESEAKRDERALRRHLASLTGFEFSEVSTDSFSDGSRGTYWPSRPSLASAVLVNKAGESVPVTFIQRRNRNVVRAVPAGEADALSPFQATV